MLILDLVLFGPTILKEETELKGNSYLQTKIFPHSIKKRLVLSLLSTLFHRAWGCKCQLLEYVKQSDHQGDESRVHSQKNCKENSWL